MRLLIAESRRAAESTAEIDWNWRRNRRDGWIDHEGEQVIYIDCWERMQGWARGTIVYLGYRWFDNPTWSRSPFRQFAAAREFKLTQPAEWEPNSLPAKTP